MFNLAITFSLGLAMKGDSVNLHLHTTHVHNFLFFRVWPHLNNFSPDQFGCRIFGSPIFQYPAFRAHSQFPITNHSRHFDRTERLFRHSAYPGWEHVWDAITCLSTICVRACVCVCVCSVKLTPVDRQFDWAIINQQGLTMKSSQTD